MFTLDHRCKGCDGRRWIVVNVKTWTLLQCAQCGQRFRTRSEKTRKLVAMTVDRTRKPLYIPKRERRKRLKAIQDDHPTPRRTVLGRNSDRKSD